jgi:DNA-3-methyladenine glycosylase II
MTTNCDFSDDLRALVALEPRFGHCLDVAGPLPPLVCRPPGFQALLRIILDQQVSVAAADAMWGRLCGRIDPVTPDTLLTLDDDTLRACGFSRQKAGYARGLAADIVEGCLDITAIDSMDDDAVLDTLVRIKGIGRWSAEIYLLLVLGRPDVWPADDLALAVGAQRLFDLPTRPTRAELTAQADPWRPHRSTAARLIWQYYRATMPSRPVSGR